MRQTARRPSPAAFTTRKGHQHLLTSRAGSSVAADLYIENSWTSAANSNVRSDYPIFGFTNYGRAPLHPVFDDDTTNGWIDLSAPVVYGARTSFEILYTGSSFDFPLNGNLVYSDTTISGTTGFRGSIMQAHNFGDPAQVPGATAADYTARWSNTRAQTVPEPGSIALLALALAALVAVRRRSR